MSNKPKALSKSEMLELAARRFFASPMEPDDVYKLLLIGNYAVRTDEKAHGDPLSWRKVNDILIIARYG